MSVTAPVSYNLNSSLYETEYAQRDREGKNVHEQSVLDEKNAVKQVVVAGAGAVLTVTSCFKGQRCK